MERFSSGVIIEVTADSCVISVKIDAVIRSFSCSKTMIYIFGIHCEGDLSNIVEEGMEVELCYKLTCPKNTPRILAVWLGEKPEFSNEDCDVIDGVYDQVGRVSYHVNENTFLVQHENYTVLVEKEVIFCDGRRNDTSAGIFVDDVISYDAIPFEIEHPTGASYRATCAWIGAKPRILDRFSQLQSTEMVSGINSAESRDNIRGIVEFVPNEVVGFVHVELKSVKVMLFRSSFDNVERERIQNVVNVNDILNLRLKHKDLFPGCRLWFVVNAFKVCGEVSEQPGLTVNDVTETEFEKVTTTKQLSHVTDTAFQYVSDIARNSMTFENCAESFTFVAENVDTKEKLMNEEKPKTDLAHVTDRAPANNAVSIENALLETSETGVVVTENVNEVLTDVKETSADWVYVTDQLFPNFRVTTKAESFLNCRNVTGSEWKSTNERENATENTSDVTDVMLSESSKDEIIVESVKEASLDNDLSVDCHGATASEGLRCVTDDDLTNHTSLHDDHTLVNLNENIIQARTDVTETTVSHIADCDSSKMSNKSEGNADLTDIVPSEFCDRSIENGHDVTETNSCINNSVDFDSEEMKEDATEMPFRDSGLESSIVEGCNVLYGDPPLFGVISRYALDCGCVTYKDFKIFLEPDNFYIDGIPCPVKHFIKFAKPGKSCVYFEGIVTNEAVLKTDGFTHKASCAWVGKKPSLTVIADTLPPRRLELLELDSQEFCGVVSKLCLPKTAFVVIPKDFATVCVTVDSFVNKCNKQSFSGENFISDFVEMNDRVIFKVKVNQSDPTLLEAFDARRTVL